MQRLRILLSLVLITLACYQASPGQLDEDGGEHGHLGEDVMKESYVQVLQTIAAYLRVLDKLKGKAVTHLETLNGGEL